MIPELLGWMPTFVWYHTVDSLDRYPAPSAPHIYGQHIGVKGGERVAPPMNSLEWDP